MAKAKRQKKADKKWLLYLSLIIFVLGLLFFGYGVSMAGERGMTAFVTIPWFATPEVCNNGVDDDLDGLTDCRDTDCCNKFYCCNEDGTCASDKKCYSICGAPASCVGYAPGDVIFKTPIVGWSNNKPIYGISEKACDIAGYTAVYDKCSATCQPTDADSICRSGTYCDSEANCVGKTIDGCSATAGMICKIQYTMTQGGPTKSGCAESGAPAEICDGKDNDCDGSIDEGLTAPAAEKQLSICKGAVKVCGGASGWVEPDYTKITYYEATETACDKKDNDCDGTVDESSSTCTNGKTCNNGVCAILVNTKFPRPDSGEGVFNEIDATGCDANTCPKWTDCSGVSKGGWDAVNNICKCSGYKALGKSYNPCLIDSAPSTVNNLRYNWDTSVCPIVRETNQILAGSEYLSKILCEPYTTETLCDDGFDNDADGKADCADSDCYETTVCLGKKICGQNGATRSCYDGSTATKGTGVCVGGMQTCSNLEWGTCTGQVLPSTEICANSKDDNCDGLTDCKDPTCANDAACAGYCIISERQSCYTGPANTINKGACAAGLQTCDVNNAWGACVGQTLPTTELCENNIDDDCDGLTDLQDAECIIQPPQPPQPYQPPSGGGGGGSTGGGGTTGGSGSSGGSGSLSWLFGDSTAPKVANATQSAASVKVGTAITFSADVTDETMLKSAVLEVNGADVQTNNLTKVKKAKVSFNYVPKVAGPMSWRIIAFDTSANKGASEGKSFTANGTENCRIQEPPASEFGECVSNSKSRTSYECDTITGKWKTTTDTTACTEQPKESPVAYIAMGLVLMIIAAAGLYHYKKDAIKGRLSRFNKPKQPAGPAQSA